MRTLSVITVVLDDCPGLHATEESLRSQTFTDFEWLVRDGGSRDGTERDLDTLDPPPAWYASAPDGGIYDAMNDALGHATGEWVLFLNAGDVLCQSDTLALVMGELVTTELDWGFGAVRNVDGGGRPIGFQNASPFNPAGLAIGQTAVPHQATFMRRSLLEALGGFRTDFGTEADQELAYRASLRGRPLELVWPITDFRVGGRGMRRPVGHFVRAMHRARREQNAPLFGNSILDRLATTALLAKEHAKVWESRISRSAGS